jgi:FixJ family two-component response regulator
MALLVAEAANATNKTIARELGISHRTVDDHRSKIMAKMQARLLSELVEMPKCCNIHRTT